MKKNLYKTKLTFTCVIFTSAFIFNACTNSFLGPAQVNSYNYDSMSTEELLELAQSYYLSAHNRNNEQEIRLSSSRSIYDYLLEERIGTLRENKASLHKTVDGYVAVTSEIFIGNKSFIALLFSAFEGFDENSLSFTNEKAADFQNSIKGLRPIFHRDILKGALYQIPLQDRTEGIFAFISLFNAAVLISDFISFLNFIEDIPSRVQTVLSNVTRLNEIVAEINGLPAMVMSMMITLDESTMMATRLREEGTPLLETTQSEITDINDIITTEIDELLDNINEIITEIENETTGADNPISSAINSALEPLKTTLQDIKTQLDTVSTTASSDLAQIMLPVIPQ